MERKRSKQVSLLLWATVTALLSQNLVIPVISSATVEDQKNYYSPDPNAGNPPSAHHSPPHGSGGGHGSRTPSHGGTPPANCGNPPSGGYTPSPTPPTGGGGYYSPPSTPSYSPPRTPSTPSTPSTPTIVSPPTTPTIDPGTPTIVSPPTTPTIDPGTPGIPGIPSPPFAFDPNSPPFTCDYWRTHPTLIWGLLGWWGTVGGAFGVASVPGSGSSISLQEALANSRTDALGALYREGTASLLNSMVNKRFPYTTRQVRNRFVAGLRSNKAAAAQAQLFKLANEGRLPRA